MNIIIKTVIGSTQFETENGELKKLYLLNYIKKYQEMVSKLTGYNGFFGLGYPFYALGNNLQGNLPLIEEQIRYNFELFLSFYGHFSNEIWPCEDCLKEKLYYMPDLKKICYKCPVVPKELSPRKVINRLPDMDLCLVVKDGYEEDIKRKLLYFFEKNGFQTSDIDPLGTIEKIYRISNELKDGKMPLEYIPLDTHLFKYSILYDLISEVEPEIDKSIKTGKAPYLPTFPDSLRKIWQQDDTAINFVFDFLYSFTEYDFDPKLLQHLKETRKLIAEKYTNEQLEKIIIETGPESMARRYKCKTLKARFNERISLWREE